MRNVIDDAFLDKEGAIWNAGLDMAHHIQKKMVPQDLRDAYEKAVLDTFDQFDDAADLATPNTSNGYHNTGTTPPMVQLVAALAGIGTPQLAEAQVDAYQPNPGAEEFIRFLHDERGVRVFFVTNSYPAAALDWAERLGVPRYRVFTMGYTPGNIPYNELTVDDGGLSVEEEAAVRWPQELLIAHKDTLKGVLDEALKAAEAGLQMIKAAPEADKEKAALSALADFRLPFRNVEDAKLRTVLEDLYVQERGIRGGRNKAKVVDDNARGDAIAMGDSIVDKDMVKRRYGITINCTNIDALGACALNVATQNWESLIPLYDAMIGGRFDPLKDEYKVAAFRTDEIAVFSRDEVRAQLPKIAKKDTRKESPVFVANDAAKSALKAQYKPRVVA